MTHVWIIERRFKDGGEWCTHPAYWYPTKKIADNERKRYYRDTEIIKYRVSKYERVEK
jgi:hypothetical protein